MYKIEKIRDEIYKMSDKNYSEFSTSLIPGENNIIGVRIPILRNMAKEISHNNPYEFLEVVGNELFEEKMLKFLVIAYMKVPIDELHKLIDWVVPEIDNWSINDSFCTTLKQFKTNQEQHWNYLNKYFNSSKEFENRFANIMLMSHFLNDNYIEKVLAVFKEFTQVKYYAKMGVAWAVATSFAKYPVKTMNFMKEWDVDSETYNMAIRKMRESYRISEEDKNILKNMKR